ncbi:ribbon-helix-helix domain-containing protein [Streptomyces rubradiris]|uniref:ribbon-helix-helix domain-containing protein n=1 Tax=Streptomyces rubradiris TaxID=285531 RepID=UPI0036F03964
MPEHTNPGGRPTIGPLVPPFNVPADLLEAIDADAARRGISRAQWLRDAASAAVSYGALGDRRALLSLLACCRLGLTACDRRGMPCV